jgi:anti-sigma regulatory factor (Ser/Thr protein kinase)
VVCGVHNVHALQKLPRDQVRSDWSRSILAAQCTATKWGFTRSSSRNTQCRFQGLVTNLSLTFPADDEYGHALRSEVRAWCAREDLPPDLCEDTLLTVSELFSNAARASLDGHHVLVRIGATVTELTIAVENTGPGFDPALLPQPSATQHGGRGIAIAQVLGIVRVEQVDEQTIVRVQIMR